MSKTSNKLISMLLCAVMVFGLFSSAAFVEIASADACGYSPEMSVSALLSSGNSAESGKSYSISGTDDLSALADYVNGGKATAGVTFYLTCDIKLGDTVWQPISSGSANAFKGLFDGCGFAVTGLNISGSSDNTAMFGYAAEGAEIINLGVNGSISGRNNIAGLVAVLSGGRISNCWSAVDVTATGVAGGIAASISGGEISNSLNYGYIKGEKAGAIAGTASGSAVIDHAYYVYYSADSALGSAASSVSSEIWRFATSSTECLTETAISIDDKSTDDLITLLNRWIKQRSDKGSYREWVFDTSAQSVQRASGKYPTQVFPGYIEPVDNMYTATATMTALYEYGNSAEQGTFYSIESPEEMLYFAEYVNSGRNTIGVTFFLISDISLAKAAGVSQQLNWTPIGNKDFPFQGAFDAQGYIVTDLYINSSSELGLFGYVDNQAAGIKNLGVFGTLIGNDSCGGIVACLVNGYVINCWFDGTITGDDRLGGIVGKCENGIITNCVDFAAITGDTKTGGIVGATNSSSTVKNCYYTIDCTSGCGETNGSQSSVVAFTTVNSTNDFTLEKSVAAGASSGVKLLNVLNHWVTNLAPDETYRNWKIDDSAESIARVRGVHPAILTPGDNSGYKYVDEPQVDVDRETNPYGVVYAETATMTELYNSGSDIIAGGHYSISSGMELEMLSHFVHDGHSTKDATFYLTSDVDISVQCLGNNAEGWLPIGSDWRITETSTLSSNAVFRGTFDGCGYKVTGLYIYNEKGDNVGLFGRARGATIKNVGVIGGIVGEFNCGGIVGKIDDGQIINCWASVSIQSESETGGIAGRIDNTSIINCASYGAGLCYGGEDAKAGGIFGDALGKSTVSNCYYIPDAIEGAYNSATNNTVISDIYEVSYGFDGNDYVCTLNKAVTIGSVITTDLLDALNAWVQDQGTILYSGWVNSTVPIDTDDTTSGHYPILMKPNDSTSGGDDTYTGDYTAISTMTMLYASTSDGIVGGAYSINSLEDLEALQKYTAEGRRTSGVIFFMTRDIDMHNKYSLDTSRSWVPIGDVSEAFKGIFDGQGYTVKNLYINNEKDDQGLFGHVTGSDAVIKNLGVAGTVRANVNAGGIVGDFNFATIANCWVSCEVTALGNNAGGIVGGANMGTITNCTSYGVVANAKAFGAIAGFAVGTQLDHCYYLYATCPQAYGGGSTPVETDVQYFNGTSAACILHEPVSIDGTTTRNALSALKLYVDRYTDVNYCYWTSGNTAEYAQLGVVMFPVLVSANGTMGGVDLKQVQAQFNGQDYYSVSSAVNAANDTEGGGTVTLVMNVSLGTNENFSIDDDVTLSTEDYSLLIKSKVCVKSMQQLSGTFIVKDGGSVCLWDESLGDYARFIYSQKKADASCNSQFYGTESLTFSSSVCEGADSSAYDLKLHSGEFIVNSSLDSGNPHRIPGGSTLTIEANATLNVSSNSRIRTTGGAVIMNYGTVKIGNATLDCNGGVKMVGLLEDNGGTVTFPFTYKEGYTLRGWSDGSSATPVKAGTNAAVPSATTYTASWAIGSSADPYPGDDFYEDNDEPNYNIPITVIQSNGGTITPDTLYAAKGENITLNITADTANDYYVKNVLVDGKSVELDENGCYMLVSVSAPHTVLALFAKNTNTAYYEYTNTFTDVTQDTWCYDYVRFVKSFGIFNGRTETTFCPDEPTTRAQFITVLWRLSGSPVMPGSDCSFIDVDKNSYYYEAVRWGTAFGIVNGYSDVQFSPYNSITRQALVSMLFRYAKNYAGVDVSLYDSTNILGYGDVMDISQGMTQAFQWAIGAGIMSGTADNMLNPKGTATRGHVAAFLSRYCNQFVLTVPVINVNA